MRRQSFGSILGMAFYVCVGRRGVGEAREINGGGMK